MDEKTGEEGELVTFSCRAKLYIWKDAQWKERGLGMCKVLQNRENKKSRIVMRREQVMKERFELFFNSSNFGTSLGSCLTLAIFESLCRVNLNKIR